MRKTTLLVSLALACMLCLGLQAAIPTNSDQTQNTAGQSTPAAQYDNDIQNQLQKALGSDKFKNLKTSVENGIVILQGTVELDAQKEEAARKAGSIDHVQGVRNKIEVVGKQVPDDQLREKLAEKLRYDRLGYGYGNVFNALTLGVQNGYVTLGGSVRDETDHASAVSLVENTPGVKGVRDEIKVEPASGFDDELRIQLARKIYGDPVLQKYAIDPQAPIRIVVDHGNVALYGVVDSELEKRVAETRAREVSGAFKVENHLMVASKEKEKEKEKSDHKEMQK
jgi:osmotically-inducible protein OsmY